jgi:hypothetical protein
MDFATICYFNELPQMKIQARSMDVFLENFPVGNIFVIVQDPDFDKCNDYFEKNVKKYYGKLIDKVRVINSDSLSKINDDNKTEQEKRYYNHMLLKMMIVRYVESQHYVTLDAKTILTSPWLIDDVLKDGRLITSTDVEPDDFWRNHVDRAFKAFNLDYTKYQSVNVLTPIFAHTCIVKSLVRRIDIMQKFKRYELEAFTLTQAATIDKFGSFEVAYFNGEHYDTIPEKYKFRWKRCLRPELCDELNQNKNLRNLLNTHGKMLGLNVHRKSISKLSEHNLNEIANILSELKIFDHSQTEEILEELKVLNP